MTIFRKPWFWFILLAAAWLALLAWMHSQGLLQEVWLDYEDKGIEDYP